MELCWWQGFAILGDMYKLELFSVVGAGLDETRELVKITASSCTGLDDVRAIAG